MTNRKAIPVSVLVAVVAMTSTATAAGPFETPVAEINAACTTASGPYAISSPVFGENGRNLVARVQASQGTNAARLEVPTGGSPSSSNTAINPGGTSRFLTGYTFDAPWAGSFTDPTRPDVSATPQARLVCASGPRDPVHINFYRRPVAPVFFPESVLNKAPGTSSAVEHQPFSAPTRAAFVANVRVFTGPVTITGALGSQELTSDTRVPLGYLQGDVSVGAAATPPTTGPAISYQIAIEALPIDVTNVVGPTLLGGTTAGRLTYTVDGQTTIQPKLVDASGRLVATLATVSAPPGNAGTPISARDQNGSVVPSGDYTLRVESSDPYGGTDTEDRPITVDTSAPAISINQPISAFTQALATITDPAGVDAAASTISIGGTTSQISPTAPGQNTYRLTPPAGGWPSSGTPVVFTLTDGFRNTETKTLLVTPPVAAATTSPGSAPAPAPGASMSLPVAPVLPTGSTPLRAPKPAVPATKSIRASFAGSRGIVVTGSTTRSSSRVSIGLRLSAKAARDLRLSRTIAAKSVSSRGGRFSATIKIRSSTVRRLRRVRRTTLQVAVTGGTTDRKTVTVTK